MSTPFDLLDIHTPDEHADSLASYFPGGFIFHALRQPDSNMRKLILGLAFELARAEQEIITYSVSVGASDTVELIDEWETAVGIPDSCFDGAGTTEERRQNVLIKLASRGVQTATDFEDIAALIGITASVLPGIDNGEDRFTIVIEFTPSVIFGVFPYTFPFVFGETGVNLMTCLFEKLKPANVSLVFIEV